MSLTESVECALLECFILSFRPCGLLRQGMDLSLSQQYIIMHQLIAGQQQDEAQRQLWKKHSFYDLKNQIALPKQAQDEITKVIQSSYDSLKNISTQQAQIMIERNNVRVVEQKTYKRGSYLTVDSMTLQKYVSFSIMGDLSRFIYSMIKNLIQIQAQIDPITHTLIQLNGVKVMDTVTSLLKISNIWDQFGLIMGIYDDDIEKRNVLAQFMFTVFTKIYNSAVQLGFAISIREFQIAIFNEKVLQNVSVDDVASIQTDAFKYNKEKNFKNHINISISTFYKGKFIELLKRKRQSYAKKQKFKFWSLITKNDYADLNQMIQDQIGSQIQEMRPGLLAKIDKNQVQSFMKEVREADREVIMKTKQEKRQQKMINKTKLIRKERQS